MNNKITFHAPRHLFGRLDKKYGENIEYLFPISVVDSAFIGKPREKSKTRNYEIKAKITGNLRINWNLKDYDILPVLFEYAREYVEKRLKTNELLTEEELVLSTKNAEDNCPFNISLIPDAKDGFTFEIDISGHIPKAPEEKKILDDTNTIKKFHQTIQKRLPCCDPVIVKFIEEAISCVYHANALLAANFMLGAASEKAIHLLIQTYADSIQNNTHKQKFSERITKRMISTKFDEFIRSYKSCRNKPTDPVLSQDLETVINMTFQFSRITRNEIGHPQLVPNLDKDVVEAHIAHFVIYIERIYALMEYFDRNGVIL